MMPGHGSTMSFLHIYMILKYVFAKYLVCYEGALSLSESI